jgi:hypothetical protein
LATFANLSSPTFFLCFLFLYLLLMGAGGCHYQVLIEKELAAPFFIFWLVLGCHRQVLVFCCFSLFLRHHHQLSTEKELAPSSSFFFVCVCVCVCV